MIKTQTKPLISFLEAFFRELLARTLPPLQSNIGDLSQYILNELKSSHFHTYGDIIQHDNGCFITAPSLLLSPNAV